MKMNDKVYNVLKWLCIVVSPALATLITGLGLLYGFQTEVIVGTITLVTAFIGAVIGISSVQYHKALEEED